MLYFIFSFLALLLLIAVFYYILKPKPNNWWNEFIKHYDEFKFYEKRGKSVVFVWNDRYTIVVEQIFGEYYASVFVYNTEGIVLCDFENKKSKELANLLRIKHQNLF